MTSHRHARGARTGRTQHEIATLPGDWKTLADDAAARGGSKADALERILSEWRKWSADKSTDSEK